MLLQYVVEDITDGDLSERVSEANGRFREVSVSL